MTVPTKYTSRKGAVLTRVAVENHIDLLRGGQDDCYQPRQCYHHHTVMPHPPYHYQSQSLWEDWHFRGRNQVKSWIRRMLHLCSCLCQQGSVETLEENFARLCSSSQMHCISDYKRRWYNWKLITRSTCNTVTRCMQKKHVSYELCILASQNCAATLYISKP